MTADQMAERGISFVSKHFCALQRRRHHGRWTWKHHWRDERGKQRWQRSKLDYFLADDVNRKRFRKCHWILPPTHDSDHRTLMVKLVTGREGVKWYKRRRRRIPFRKLKKKDITEGAHV